MRLSPPTKNNRPPSPWEYSFGPRYFNCYFFLKEVPGTVPRSCDLWTNFNLSLVSRYWVNLLEIEVWFSWELGFWDHHIFGATSGAQVCPLVAFLSRIGCFLTVFLTPPQDHPWWCWRVYFRPPLDQTRWMVTSYHILDLWTRSGWRAAESVLPFCVHFLKSGHKCVLPFPNPGLHFLDPKQLLVLYRARTWR